MWKNSFVERKSLLVYQKMHIRPQYKLESRFTQLLCKKLNKACYTMENDTELRTLRHATDQSLQPRKTKPCTMLLIQNMAEPEWLSVDCNHKYLSQVACVEKTTKPPNATLALLSNVTCTKHQVLWKNWCFNFSTVRHQSLHRELLNERCKRLKMDTYLVVTLVQTDPDVFDLILKATSTHSVTVVSLSPEKRDTIVLATLGKIMNEVTYEENRADTAISACYSQVAKRENIGGNNMPCQQGHFVSSLRICDSKHSCALDHKVLNHLVQSCYRNQESSLKHTCHPLLYKSISGVCKPYVHILPLPGSGAVLLKQSYTCSDGSSIPMTFVDDLVPDCREDEDEPQYLNLLSSGTFEHCSLADQLPCILGHSMCYQISQVCVFRLDEHQVLTPCRTGSHVQVCEDFQCNGYFKCPGSYCIPWSFVCNGRRDCPEGQEEVACESMDCAGLVKCHSSSLCIHLNDVCDNNLDCPSNDDESLCQLQKFKCPRSCLCLNLAMSCDDVADVIFKSMSYFPHILYSCSCCGLHTVAEFSFNPNLSSVNLSSNCLSTVPEAAQFKFLKTLDVSNNKIEYLEKNSFQDQFYLQCAILKENNIAQIEDAAFHNLSEVCVIDLSKNNLSYFSARMLSNVRHLRVLNMLHNEIITIDTEHFHINIEMIYSDTFKLCCGQFGVLKCLYHLLAEQLNVCSRLLLSKHLNILTLCITVLTVVPNAICFSYCVKILYSTAKPTSHSKPYNIFTCALSFLHFFLAAYLLLIWAADEYYQDVYFMFVDNWTESHFCSASFLVHLFYQIAMPIVLTSFHLSRLQVILYPFDSNFKSGKFVAKYLSLVIFVLFLLCVAVFIPNVLLQTVSFGFCSPFIHTTFSWMHVVFTSFLLALHIVALLVILIAKILMVRGMKSSQEAAGKGRAVGKGVFVQLTSLYATHAFSWLSVSPTYLVSQFLPLYPLVAVVHITITCAPTNAILNPVVFIVAMTKK